METHQKPAAADFWKNDQISGIFSPKLPWPERIYNPIKAMGFSEKFTFQLDITKR